MSRDPGSESHPDTPSPEERRSVVGSIGEPRAYPATLFWTCVAIVVVGLVILAIVRMTSEPDDRAPLPATPPESVEPAEGSPIGQFNRHRSILALW